MSRCRLAIVLTLLVMPFDAFGYTTVWQGYVGTLTVETLAETLAPILWFSRDEPLLRAGRAIPEKLPCDAQLSNGPVAYYWARQNGRILTKPVDQIEVRDGLRVSITFGFYYSQDFGTGCHSNDLERAVFEVRIRSLGSAEADESFVAELTSVEGAAHGRRIFSNLLVFGRLRDPADDISLPMVLLVEEGKHAVCPDRNGDGFYTPGYDVNANHNQAWGIRDTFGVGFGGGGRYQAYMTKPRFAEDRIRADVRNRGTLSRNYRSPWPLPDRVYTLRPLPQPCKDSAPDNAWEEASPMSGCGRTSLDGLLGDAGVRDAAPARAAWRWLRNNFSGFGLRIDDDSYSMVGQVPLAEEVGTGGVIGLQAIVRVQQWSPSDNEWTFGAGGDAQIFYTPSLSSMGNWHMAAGYGADTRRPERFGGPVAEVGVKFRLPSWYFALNWVYRRSDWNTALEFGLGFQ